MSRFKVVKETVITDENKNTEMIDCIDLTEYLKKTIKLTRIDNKYYEGPKFVKSPCGKHIFEIYDEFHKYETKKLDKHIKKLDILNVLTEINEKLDSILLNIKK